MRWRAMYQPTIPGGAEPPRPAPVPENLSAEPSLAERRPIIGREREIAALTAAVTSGSPAPVVVISGPHGSGKTLLLNHTRRHAEAAGRIALRTAGVPAESGQPLAGLDHLLRALPRGIAAAPPGPGFLHVLRELGSRHRVAVFVDDVHHLDAVSRAAIMFAARRLVGNAVTMVLATRDTACPDGLGRGDVTALTIEALTAHQSEVLLDQQPVPAFGLRREAILAQAQGNPGAVVAFGNLSAEWDGGWAPDPIPLPAGLRSAYRDDLAALPTDTRTALLTLAAAGPDIELVAATLGTDVLAGARAAGLLGADERSVRFVDPLTRSACYSEGTITQRRAAHRRIADMLNERPHRQIWHAALGADGIDDDIADRLVALAAATREIDGAGAAAAALQRAAALTSRPAAQADRLLDAAKLARHTGDVRWEKQLGQRAKEVATDARQRMRAQIELGWSALWNDNHHKTFLALNTATGTARLVDPAWSWEALRAMGILAYLTDDPAIRRTVAEHRTLLSDIGQTDTKVAMSQAWIDAVTDPMSATMSRHTVAALTNRFDDPVYRGILGATAWMAADSETALRLLNTSGNGNLSAAPGSAVILTALARACLETGRLAQASDAAAQLQTLGGTNEKPLMAAVGHFTVGAVATLRGDFDTARGHLAAAMNRVVLNESRIAGAWAGHLGGQINLFDGAPALAYAELSELFTATGHPLHRRESYWALGDFADAAVAASTTADAGRRLTAILEHIPADAPTRLVHLISYARAALTDRDEGESLLGAALADPAGEQWPVDRARLLIAHAALLRRHRRRSESQHQLSRALSIAQRLQSRPLIELCTRDLRAAGVRPVLPAAAATNLPLSPQEHQVVYLAGLGWTNPQIAARLQLSTRTVSNHLYRSFPKLGITRRQQIRDIPAPGGLGPVDTAASG